MYLDSTHGTGMGSDFKFAWSYRHFMLHLVASDLRSRFRRTHLGIIWALLLPLMFASALTILFSTVFKQPWQEMVLYIYSGTILWDFFSTSANRGADSFIESTGYIKQTRMPLIIFPIRVVLSSAAYFAISLIGLLLLVVFINPAHLSAYWIFVVPFIFIMTLICVPIAILCGFINTVFRDFHPTLSIILQFLSFLSPIFIPKEAYLSENMRIFSEINPVFALCNILREPLLHARIPTAHDFFVVLIWGTMLWIVAILFARSIDKKMVYYL